MTDDIIEVAQRARDGEWQTAECVRMLAQALLDRDAEVRRLRVDACSNCHGIRYRLRRACDLLRSIRREVFTLNLTDRYGDGEVIDYFLREVGEP